jgi:hypothetical protein
MGKNDEYAESAITCHVWMCWQAGSCMNVWQDDFIQRTWLLATLAISLVGRWTSFLQHHILCRYLVLVPEKKTMLPAHHRLACDFVKHLGWASITHNGRGRLSCGVG